VCKEAFASGRRGSRRVAYRRQAAQGPRARSTCGLRRRRREDRSSRTRCRAQVVMRRGPEGGGRWRR
ncbi:unnamed protein product, partial [Ectocarpus sp. 8 AP-2014]